MGISDGLKATGDTGQAACTTGQSWLHDGTRYTGTKESMAKYGSFAVDMGSQTDLLSISCYGFTYDTPTGFYGSNNDSMSVYKSDSNTLGSWTKIADYDGPALIHSAANEWGWKLDFGGTHTARYFKVNCKDALATSPMGYSFEICEVEVEYSSLEYLEDASLDLSVYGRNLENLQAFLRAHDGVEVHDLQAALAAYNLSEEDFAGWLGAFFEDKSDLGAILETWATQYKDLAGDFDAKGQSIESLMSHFSTAKDNFMNLAAFLSVTDGDVLKDLAAFLSVTDGTVLKNLGLSLRATKSIPAFRSNIAQRVSSVVHEVS